MCFKLVFLFLVLDVIHGFYYSTPYAEGNDPFKWWYLKSHQHQNDQLMQADDTEKVKIQLYYEALCPFSIQFHVNDFNITVNQLAPYLDFQSYPYGNALTHIDEDGKVSFKCQHGQNECYGNMLHACAIDSLGMTTKAVIFNSCMMSFKQSSGRSDDSSADKCGELLTVDSEPIKACAKGDKGIELLKYYGDKTKKGKKSGAGVPYVLINGEKINVDNFMKTVCQAFKTPPPECQ